MLNHLCLSFINDTVSQEMRVYLIVKSLVKSVDESSLVRPLTAYFIIHNRIYQSPDVYSVLSNRLVSSSARISFAA